MKNRKFRAPEVCPVCGEDVPRGSLACPECGADERSGWREDADLYDGLDLPDEDFDYDEFVQREFGEGKPAGNGLGMWWWVALALLIAMLWEIFGR